MDTNNGMYGLERNSFNESSAQVTDSQSIPVYANVQTYPCSNCGRSFNTESLRKHQPICKKTSQKQPRRVFDTGKQRATDSDIPYKATKETTEFYTAGIKPKSEKQKIKSNKWREGHEELVRTIRQARQITRAIETGAPLPKKLPAQVPSDYVQCEYCQRHFNKYSAERHIPFCETQYKRKHKNYAPTNNRRTPPRNVGRQEHQVSSAPTKLVTKRPPKINGEKDYLRATFNPNEYKQTTYNETMDTPTNGTPPKYGNHRTIKTHSATGNHLPGMMRTGRTTENDGLNEVAGGGGGGGGRVQQKSDTSPQFPPRMTRIKTRSPSPGYRPSQANDGHQQQEQQKTRVPTAAKHCHGCGEAFPVEWAKFCCECGEKRFGVE